MCMFICICLYIYIFVFILYCIIYILLYIYCIYILYTNPNPKMRSGISTPEHMHNAQNIPVNRKEAMYDIDDLLCFYDNRQNITMLCNGCLLHTIFGAFLLIC